MPVRAAAGIHGGTTMRWLRVSGAVWLVVITFLGALALPAAPARAGAAGLDPASAPAVFAPQGRVRTAALASGTALAWGANFINQLGFVSPFDYYTPQEVPSGAGIVAIAAGDAHSLALRYDGVVRSWGSNGSGQLGVGVATCGGAP